jgi:tripartite-type tricarboxylate transporter receptor subunit TctC
MVVGLFIVSLFYFVQAQDFPTKDLSGIIMWGAGGATDNVARALAATKNDRNILTSFKNIKDPIRNR